MVVYTLRIVGMKGMGYINMSLLILFVISTALSTGVVYLPSEVILAWSFPTTETVKFELRVPQAVFDSYDWIGIGLKNVNSGSGMSGADIANIIFKTPIQDSFAPPRGGPVSDESLGGTCDLIRPDSHVDGRGINYFWEKQLNTGDKYDIVLTSGGEYRLLYAKGKVTPEGVQLQHGYEDRGTIDIVLSDDFRDTSLKYTFLQIN